MYDVVIIGSGPAGMSAAIYAKRAMLNVVVIEKEAFMGGQIIYSEQVDNYPGMYGVKGFNLANSMREHAEALEVKFMDGKVSNVEDRGSYKIINLTDGTSIDSRTIVVATGARHRHLGIEGEESYIGSGISYCATCDGAFFRKRVTACVGGGDVALSDALYLSKICEKVYLIHRRDEFRAAKTIIEQVKNTPNIELLTPYEVHKISGDGIIENIVVTNSNTGEERELEISGLFIAVGMEPETDFVADLIERDEQGYIVAGEDTLTNVPGIMVAGDVRTKKLRQVVTAVADGACAIQAVEEYLQEIP